MSPRRRSAKEMFDAAFAAMEAAHAQARVESAASAARVAKLLHAAELEKSGQMREAARVIREVEREQARG